MEGTIKFVIMTVYLDVVFLENFVMNLVIILSEAVLLGGFKKFFRKVIASGILSVFYIATLFYSGIATFQIIVALFAVWISFEPKSIKKLIKELLLFYFISFIFGGLSFAMVSLFNNGKVTILDGVLVSDFSAFKVVLCGVLGAFLVVIFLKKKREHVFKEIVIGLEEKEALVKVLLDTGNLLREPYTGKPVIIVEKNAVKGILNSDIVSNFQEIIKRKKRCANWNVFNTVQKHWE